MLGMLGKRDCPWTLDLWSTIRACRAPMIFFLALSLSFSTQLRAESLSSAPAYAAVAISAEDKSVIDGLRECRPATVGDVASCTALSALIAAITPYLLPMAGATGSALAALQAQVIAAAAQLGITLTTAQVSGLSLIVAGGTGVSCVSVSDWAKAILRASGLPQVVMSMAASCLAVIEDYGAGCLAIKDICVQQVTGGPVVEPNAGDGDGVALGRECASQWVFNPFITRCEACAACCAPLPYDKVMGCYAVCNAQFNCGLTTFRP